MISKTFNTKHIAEYLLALSFISLLCYLNFYNLKSFLFLLDSFEAIFGFIIMIIAIGTYSISKNETFTFLAISLGAASIVEILSLLFNHLNSSNALLSEYMYIQIFGSILKIFAMIVCCKFYNKHINLKVVTLFYTLIVSCFILVSFILKILPSIYTIILLDYNIKDILNFLMYLASLYQLYIFCRNRDIYSFSDRQTLGYISILYNIAIFLFFVHESAISSSIFKFIGNVSLLFHLFFMFKIIIHSVLVKPYNEIFHALYEKNSELLHSKNSYKNLIESLPASVFITKDDTVLFTNKTASILFECGKTDCLNGMNIKSLISDKQILDSSEFETELRTLKNNKFCAEVSQINILFDNEPCLLILILEISLRKKIDVLNLKLERKIEEDILRTEFFSNLSHEFRTPINIIYGTLQIEDMYIKNKDIDSIKKHTGLLMQNCFRLLRLCNNLIDISNIDSGCFKPYLKNKNIVPIIKNVVSSVALYVDNRGMNITFDTEVEEVFVLCDSDLIEKIILNLISNSLKYGDENGSIWINVCDGLETITIIFKDDGPGIPKDRCGDIFEKFIQIDKSFRRISEGSGLGLSLVKSLIKIHDGSISLESDIGLGCKFTIKLPKSSNYNVDDMNTDKSIGNINITDKVNVEFSDIYL